MTEAVYKPVGLTQSAGWQIGVRRTLPISLDAAWAFLTSTAGLNQWLGKTPGVELYQGRIYVLADGTVGEVRIFKPGSHVRLTWRPSGWGRASTIQLRVLPKRGGTVIAFHQDRLPDSAAREQRRAHFMEVLDALEGMLATA